MLKWIESHVGVWTIVLTLMGGAFSVGLLVGQQNMAQIQRELELYQRLDPKELKNLTVSISKGLQDLRIAGSDRDELRVLRRERAAIVKQRDDILAERNALYAKLEAQKMPGVIVFKKSDENHAVLINKNEYISIEIGSSYLSIRQDDDSDILRISETFRTKRGCVITLLEVESEKSATVELKC